MYRTDHVFHAKLQAGATPVPYVVVTTPMGSRAYASKDLMEFFSIGAHIADGSTIADGSIHAGSDYAAMLEQSGRLLSPGSFERTISPSNKDILTSYESKQRQHITIRLANADRYFSRLLASEPFIGRPLSVYLGFDYLPQYQHLCLFSGTVNTVTIQRQEMTLEADER